MKKFAIPQGTRDLILGECSAKRRLQYAIESVFESYGYRDIVTPSIEFYQTYQTGFDNVKDEQMYKFFDQNGKILTLRMDMTIPIARVAATKFKDQHPPFRFRYCANVYKVKESLLGKQNEVSDCGVELLGLTSEESDLEIIVCALEVMQTMKQQAYTLEIGNVNFFQSACADVALSVEQMEILADLIDRKSMIELKEYLDSLPLDEQYKNFFLQLPYLCGDAQVLEDAKAYCFNENLTMIVDELILLYNQIKALHYENHITFDLGKVPHLNYYSGMIFEGFIANIGTSVISGGRYDTLLEKFGLPMPAIGFSVKLDYVLPVLSNENDEKKTVTLCYPKAQKIEAILKARELRAKYHVEMLCCTCASIEVEGECVE